MPEMWAVQKEGRFVPGVLATNEHKTKLQAREREEWVSWELMEYMGYRIVRVKVEEVG